MAYSVTGHSVDMGLVTACSMAVDMVTAHSMDMGHVTTGSMDTCNCLVAQCIFIKA